MFNIYWPQFESDFQKALSDHPIGAKPKKREDRDVLSEILEGVRGLNHRVAKLEESGHERNIGLMSEMKKAESRNSHDLDNWRKILATSEAARRQADDFMSAIKEIRALNDKHST